MKWQIHQGLIQACANQITSVSNFRIYISKDVFNLVVSYIQFKATDAVHY